MLFDGQLFLILSLIWMKSIVLWLIIEVIITQPMFKAGYYCFEVFYVMIVLIMNIILTNQLLRIHKDVRYLFLHLTTYLHSNDRITFSFNK